jgi:hypothetical protein
MLGNTAPSLAKNLFTISEAQRISRARFNAGRDDYVCEEAVVFLSAEWLSIES